MLIWERREDLPKVLEGLGLNGPEHTGVEVGVQAGGYAATLLRKGWRGRLVLVDPWRHLPGYEDDANVDDAAQEALYQRALAATQAVAPGRVDVLRVTSLVAAAAMTPAQLAFVYVDADHSYSAVLADLRAWWPLVRSGGVLAGHDWVEDGDRPYGKFGVRKAVREFFADALPGFDEARDLHVTTRNEDVAASWLVVKP